MQTDVKHSKKSTAWKQNALTYRDKIQEWESRSMPASDEAEAALLGAIILDPKQLAIVLPILPNDSWFRKMSFAAVYRHAIAEWNDTGNIDIIGLKQRLEDSGLLADIGGVPALTGLGEAVPDPSNAAYYAGMVREKGIARRIMDACGRAMQAGFDLAAPKVMLEDLHREINALSLGINQRSASTIGEIMQDLYEDLSNRERGTSGGVLTGFHDLDKITCGLHNGQMIVVAGRPGMGKSLFASNVAENFAARDDGVLMFSLEMSREELGMRFACSMARVDFDAIRRNMMSKEEFERLQIKVGEVSDWPLFVDDTGSLSTGMMKATVRRIAQDKPLRLVVVDYLQLMTGPGDSRQEVVAALSREMKSLAREMNLPVICISQLNRGLESREEKRPRMSDLRESGAIEQDADVILFVHRPHYYLSEVEKAEQRHLEYVAEIIVAKQRNGPTGIVELIFDGASQQFKDKEFQYGNL